MELGETISQRADRTNVTGSLWTRMTRCVPSQRYFEQPSSVRIASRPSSHPYHNRHTQGLCLRWASQISHCLSSSLHISQCSMWTGDTTHVKGAPPRQNLVQEGERHYFNACSLAKILGILAGFGLKYQANSKKLWGIRMHFYWPHVK